jgi:hypothetical protein
MTSVYLLSDVEKNVVAIYDNEELANKMKKPIEEKLKVELTIEKRSINLDLKVIGVFK